MSLNQKNNPYRRLSDPPPSAISNNEIQNKEIPSISPFNDPFFQSSILFEKLVIVKRDDYSTKNRDAGHRYSNVCLILDNVEKESSPKFLAKMS